MSYDSYLTQYQKIYSKWNIDLNVRAKAITFLEEITRGKIFTPFSEIKFSESSFIDCAFGVTNGQHQDKNF